MPRTRSSTKTAVKATHAIHREHQKTTRPFRKVPKKRKRVGRYQASGQGRIIIKEGRILLTLPRRLRSYNRRGGFWSEYRDRQMWAKLIDEAVVDTDHTIALPVTERMRLELIRMAPNKRYMLDKDNLEISGKRLVDSLVSKGYLVDDNRYWLDGPWLSQAISSDKCYWTLAKLTIAAPYEESKDEAQSPDVLAKRLLARLHRSRYVA